MGQNLPWLSSSTIGPKETAGKNVRPPIMTMTPMVRPMNMALSVRKVPRDAGTTFLAASAPPRYSREPATVRVMGMQASEEDLAGIFTSLWPHFNERDRRLVAAACAQAMGHGGVTTESETSGLSRPTVTKAISELHEEPFPPGGCAKKALGADALTKPTQGSKRALDALVEPDSRGDPESPLRWTIKSTRQFASALSDAGRPVSPSTVSSLLYRLGYSLQSNAKVLEGAQHPDRNAQFGYINEQVRRHLRRGEPVGLGRR